jgi:hypothetical protein
VKSPSSTELRAYMRRHRLQGQVVADLLGVSRRTVYRWTAPEGTAAHTPMPEAQWFVLTKRNYNER